MTELKKNIEEYRNVYFVGIGGVSMSALALILKSKGIAVSGYDRSHSHETDILENHGVFITYDENSSLPADTDLCVYTAAVNTSHPIVSQAVTKSIECVTRAVLLGEIADCYGVSIGVAGTHGKSTTSGMISSIYNQAPDCDPSFAVGALLPFINAYYKVGTDGNFVFEADEYKDSFLHFRPTTSVVLNVCHDHPDYFKDLEQTVNSFRKYVSHSEKAVFCLDCEGSVQSSLGFEGQKYFYSVKQKADFYAENIRMLGGKGSFTLCYPDGKVNVSLSVPGEHNISNALAAFCACYINGLEVQAIVDGMENFKGISRRFEKIAEINGATVISDYSHHPDEISACLKTARQIARNRVITVFQPHTFSRLANLFEDFVSALSVSDICCVTDVFSARETDTRGVSGELLAQKLNGVYIPSFEAGAEFILTNASCGDVIVIMGAGDIYKIGEILQKNS